MLSKSGKWSYVMYEALKWKDDGVTKAWVYEGEITTRRGRMLDFL